MREIKLRNGFICIVDDEDFEELSKFPWRARIHSNGLKHAYFCKRVKKGKTRYIWMHRLIAKTPDGYTTDHKNRDGLDNRKENLRTATRIQNGQNKGPLNLKKRKKQSQYKGVCLRRDFKSWQAQIKIDGKFINIGSTFKTEEDAAKAYDEMAKKHFGQFAYLNFL